MDLVESFGKGELAMRIWIAGTAAALAVAVVLCFLGAGPVQAAKAKATSAVDSDRPIVLSKFKKRSAQAAKKSRTAHSRSQRKTVSKVTTRKALSKLARQMPADEEDTPRANGKPAIPSAVANARAEAFANDQAKNIAALDSTDVVTTKDGVQIASADQLNDADRALSDSATADQNVTPAAPAPEAVSAPVSAPKIIRATTSGERQSVKTGDDDPWTKTSLIGKIFVAFGSLLTLASAARLLIT